MSDHPLLDLAASAEVKQVKTFTETAKGLTGTSLAEMYAAEKSSAAAEAEADPKHFPDLSGEVEGEPEPTTAQLSAAIFNTCRESDYHISIPGTEDSLEVIAYQALMTALPKSRRKARFRPVHTAPVLGLNDAGRLGVMKLEVMPQKSTKGDSPLKLLLDGLALCAAVDAHGATLRSQATEQLEKTIGGDAPMLLVLANNRYWDLYHRRAQKTAGPWFSELKRLCDEIEASIGVHVSVCGTRLYGDPGWRMRQGRPFLETEPEFFNALERPAAKPKKARTRTAEVEEEVEADLDRPPRPYTPKEHYFRAIGSSTRRSAWASCSGRSAEQGPGPLRRPDAGARAGSLVSRPVPPGLSPGSGC